MTPGTLSPASIKIDYHTLYAPHSMTIPTRDWIPTPVSGDLGSYLNWDGTPCDGEVMVRGLIEVLKVFMLPSTQFDQATAYTMATPTSSNIPRKSTSLAVVGTSIDTTPSQAVSATFNFKTTDNGDVKLVLLDSPIGGLWFAPVLPADFSSAVYAVETVFTGQAWAWSGRDDTRPAVLRKITKDLNDKLQKEYWG
jgi:hypothetical protein